MKITFSVNLRELRKEKKLSQGQLGDAVGMTQRKISYMESGKIEPSLSGLWIFSDYFCVSIDFLVGKKEY